MHPLSDDLTLDHVSPDRNKSNDENLVTCCMECNLSKGRKTPDFYLAKLIEQREIEEKSEISNNEVKNILEAIAKSHNITYKQLVGKSRKAHFVKARAEAIKRLRRDGLTLVHIGELLGYRDHTTILHHLEKNQSSYQ